MSIYHDGCQQQLTNVYAWCYHTGNLTKLAPNLMDKTYEERLLALNLTTLELKRERGDLITVYRMMKGMEDLDRDDLITWDTRNTRRHDKMIKKIFVGGASRRSFPHRVVDVWNGLKIELVQTETISEFKAKLDIELFVVLQLLSFLSSPLLVDSGTTFLCLYYLLPTTYSSTRGRCQDALHSELDMLFLSFLSLFFFLFFSSGDYTGLFCYFFVRAFELSLML